MEMNLKIRIGYTPGIRSLPSGSQLKQLVKIGDKYNYDSIWLSDHVLGEHPLLEPTVALSLIAAYSTKLKFGTSVLALPLRNPIILAKQLATLDYLSNGRLLPAFGLGQNDPIQYKACGIDMKTRGNRANESIQLIRRLWTEPRVTHHGTFFSLDNVSLLPKPSQKPAPPIWIGGRSRAAQRRTGIVGDGWLTSQTTPTEIKAGIKFISSVARSHNRIIDPNHIGAIMGFYISENPRIHLTPEWANIQTRRDVSAMEYTAIGTTEEIAKKIESFVKAGASKFIMRPLGPSEESADQLSLFGEEILPIFHK